ncbi:MAG: hypothetical protein A2Y25_07520 [Candidatus Melainabacteria bacterium GWF2_37_15]|nr:MAG: hypothetical protein A2Y25_07520 [Candidatus Melainabacteria bacterium GWF2_37_15]
MQKTLSLKELPHKFISSGMTLPELSGYLGVSEELIREWERFFNLFPEKEAQGGDQKEKVYSQKRIRDFIKIKDGIDRGTSLYDIRKKIFKIDVEPEKNPFENNQNVVEFKVEEEKATSVINEDAIIKPFLTQITRANERIGELILEKAKIVEETAIEKANLMAELKILQAKNTEVLAERENLFAVIKDREEQFKRSSIQESILAESLKFSHEMLKQKEEEISYTRNRIEAYEKELREKDSIIYNQSEELSKLLEKQNKKWWHCLRDIFF